MIVNSEIARGRVVSGALAIAAFLGMAWSTPSTAAHPVENLAAGHWYRATNTQLSALDPCPSSGCSYSANEGQSAVMNDWNGGAFATGYGTMGGLIVWGGGHNGYFGNEVYAFDVANLRWERLNSPVANPDCSYTEGELQNGSPCAAHTYDYMDYHPASNSLVKLGSASDHDQGGYGSPRVHLFDLAARTWRRGARKPTFPGVNGEDGYGHTGASSAYDPNRDAFWVLPAYNGRFGKYDPNAGGGAGQWTEYNRYNIDIDAVSAIDPIRDLFVTFEALLTQTIIVHDLKNPSAAGVTVPVTGDRSFFNEKGNGFEWDPVSKAFVGWMGGTSVYKVIPPASGDWRTTAWQIVKVAPASTNSVSPSPKNMNDTYSRWRYVPALNAFVVANSTTSDVYFYKLSAGGSAPPPAQTTVNLSANPTSVAAQGTSQLAWSSTNASACTASGAWSGTKATSGSESRGPLTATSVFTLTCTNTSGGSASKSVTVNVAGSTSPSADWQARSTAAGVVYATSFPQSVVDAGRFANGWDPALMANVVFNATGGVDGQGALRINVPRWTANDPGAWHMQFPRFWGSGVNHTRFYVQFRFKISSGRATGCPSGDGWKLANISSYNRSLTSFEVVPWSPYNSGTLEAYYGGSPPFEPDPSPDFNLPENEWITAYVEIQAARYDGSDANNRMILKAARQAATQWTTLYNLTGGDWYGSDSDAPDGFDGMWFTPYSTNRQANVCPDGWHEYDELIISTQPIALPGGGSSTPPPPPPNAPTLAFSANPTSVASGGRSTLDWTTTNATGCTASGAWAGNKAASGTEQTPTLSTAKTFTLQCAGTGGSVSKSVNVAVTAPAPKPKPVVTLTANPTSVYWKRRSTLAWTSKNATSCTASGAWSGAKALSGSQRTARLTSARTYKLTCTGAGGAASKSVTVSMR